MNSPRNLSRLFFVALIQTAMFSLVACGTPSTRADNPELFKQLSRGKVKPDQMQDLTDCIMDGFARSQKQGSNVQVVQQRRASGYRAEVMTGPHLILSADVNRDGSTQLLEGYAAGLISTKKEVAEYEACLTRFQNS